jgi:hypothetical protein
MWIWSVYRGQNGPNSAASVSWEATFDAPSGLFRQFHDGVRLVPAPMGENFSGSCIVTSRNPLIHIGATTATKSGRSHPKGVLQGLLSGDSRCVEESLATANFREFLYYELR